jgi:[acyl-carrier-protein] S-malonyltransferase
VVVGSLINVGHVIGVVGESEVRSPFAGVVQNFIAVEGERVTTHQPIAWLRSV